jgi:hypothetical protein
VERVGQLTDTIQKSLRGAGYSGVRFFGVGSDGVALVTDLEQTDEAGRPVTGERWVPLMQEPRTSDWREYIINLFHRPRGHFRVFTFIITPRELYYDPTKTIDEAVVKEWQKRGSMILPSRLGQLPLSDAYKVYILVYQFVKEEGQIPKVVKGDPVSNLLKLAGIKLIRGQQ